jgi:thymidylate synthase
LVKESDSLLEPVYLEAFTIPEAWNLLQRKLWEIDAVEYVVDFGSSVGKIRREFPYVTCLIKQPWVRPLCDTLLKPGVIPPATPDIIEKYFNEYLLNPDIPGQELYTYGTRICEQIDTIINNFKTQGYNQAKCCIEVASPQDTIRNKSMPCMRLINICVRFAPVDQVYRMQFFVFFRVWDLWGGFPVNVGGLQLLKEWLIEQIKDYNKTDYPLEDGEILVASPELNLREYAFEMSKAYLSLA